MDATILLETLKIELEKLNRDVEMVDESQLDRLADIYVNLSAEIGVLDRVLEKGFSLDSAEWGKNIVKKSLKRKTEEFLLKRVRCLIDQIVREIASNRDLHKNVEEKRKLLEKVLFCIEYGKFTKKLQNFFLFHCFFDSFLFFSFLFAEKG